MNVADKRELKTDTSRKKNKKKDWESPRIKSGQLFEASSLACGKSDRMVDQCNGKDGAPSTS
jgi:hypothetical protein